MAITFKSSKIERKKRCQNSVVPSFFKKYINIHFAKYLLFNQEALPIVGALILLGELFLNILIINNVPYTEIDWTAYMQECEGFLNGTTNYALLKGDTGPLVYPAGFLYMYSALYFATSRGKNILLAQYIFALIYLIQIYLVIRLYAKTRKLPPYVLILSIFTSYRIHSIYVLRLFNDPIAILFVYLAISLFFEQKWSLGSICFSLGVSIKMNILLFAPAVFILYITNLGYFKTFKQLVLCALVQLVLGAPFLLTYPKEYIQGSFDLGRVFEHKWTVNYRFLSRSLFENKLFHFSLLGIHLLLVAIFTVPMFVYFKNYCRLRELQRQLEPQIKRQNIEAKKSRNKKDLSKHTSEQLSAEQQLFLDSFEEKLKKSGDYNTNIAAEETSFQEFSIQFDRCVQLALLPLFACNLLGIICARSLHYQFYVWYFHSLPYLAWCTNYNMGLRFLILGLIEYCWNTYPSTVLSSALLHICHLVLLIGVGQNMFSTKSRSEKLSKFQ